MVSSLRIVTPAGRAAPRSVGGTRLAPHDHVAELELDGRRVVVEVRVAYDGVEHVGRLWFADRLSPDPELASGIPDRAPIPGRTRDEVVARAERLAHEDLGRRYERALAERRRFRALRETTEEVLARIRYLNRVAVLARDGQLDAAGGAQELELTERQLHGLVAELRRHAGIEGAGRAK